VVDWRKSRCDLCGKRTHKAASVRLGLTTRHRVCNLRALAPAERVPLRIRGGTMNQPKPGKIGESQQGAWYTCRTCGNTWKAGNLAAVCPSCREAKDKPTRPPWQRI
jgi:hypothetical protein